MNNANTPIIDDRVLTSRLTDGRVVVTFAEDLPADALTHDTDALHHLHVKRVRDHITARNAGAAADITEVLPTGRTVTMDGTNWGGSRVNDAGRIRRRIAALEHRLAILETHFDGVKWARDEAGTILPKLAALTVELEPHEAARQRKRNARWARDYRARLSGSRRVLSAPQQLRHDTLAADHNMTQRGISDPIGAESIHRRSLAAAQVAA